MAIIVNSQTKLTYEEYVLFPDDGKIHEIIDGEHHMTPAPGTYHQTVSRRMQFQLYEQIEKKGLGQVYDAPTDVELSRIDIVQPDIVVVLAERTRIISPARIIGPPDLVIEILSDTTREKDETLKFTLYQSAKIPEYWLVEPQGQDVKKFVRSEDRFVLAGTFHDEIEFTGPAGVTVNLREVW